jgi:hypothetical protein
LHADSYVATVRSVQVLATSADRAVLEVVDRRARYRLVSVLGAVAATSPARSEPAWRVAFARDPASRWLVTDVAPLTGR